MIDYDYTFDHFWEVYSHNFDLLDEGEVRARYEALVTKIKDAQERARIRKERMRARILFWVNFSRAFIKWFLYAFYIALGAGALWLASICFWPVIGFVQWLFSYDFPSLIPILIIGGKIFFCIMVVVGIVAIFHRFRIMQAIGETALDGALTCCIPLVVVGKMIAAPFKWLGKGCYSVVEFVQVFYEENCPPISIVSDDEAAIEEAVEEGSL